MTQGPPTPTNIFEGWVGLDTFLVRVRARARANQGGQMGCAQGGWFMI